MGTVPRRGGRESPAVVGYDGCLVHGLERHRRVVRGLRSLLAMRLFLFLLSVYLDLVLPLFSHFSPLFTLFLFCSFFFLATRLCLHVLVSCPR